MQIWSQKNPVQELRIVPINLEESLYPREQCVRQRRTWRYSYKEYLKDGIYESDLIENIRKKL